MNDNDKLHEPEVIGNLKNALGYGVVTGFVIGMTMLIFGGLIAPFFLPKAFKAVNEFSVDSNRTLNRWIAVGIIFLWFVLSWFFVLVAYAMDGAWLVKWGWIDQHGNWLIGK